MKILNWLKGRDPYQITLLLVLVAMLSPLAGNFVCLKWLMEHALFIYLFFCFTEILQLSFDKQERFKQGERVVLFILGILGVLLSGTFIFVV